MPGRDRHSRLVARLKLVLPLAALMLLSTLFLVAERIDPDAAIPYAQVDVEALANDPRITAPSYAGTTSDGGALTINAETARTGTAQNGAMATGITAQLTMPLGGAARLAAGKMHFDQVAGMVHLKEDVRIDTSSGYHIRSQALDLRLDRSALISEGAVEADTPSGRLTAGRFDLRQNPVSDAENPYLLVFSDGVKLLYDPKGGPAAAAE